MSGNGENSAETLRLNGSFKSGKTKIKSGDNKTGAGEALETIIIINFISIRHQSHTKICSSIEPCVT